MKIRNFLAAITLSVALAGAGIAWHGAPQTTFIAGGSSNVNKPDAG